MNRLSRLLALLVLAALLVVPVCEAKFNPRSSIRPFQRLEGAQLTTVCTAWATRRGDILGWVTAYHCIADDEGTVMLADWYVDGKRAVPVAWDGAADLAFFKGGPNVQPLGIGLRQPTPGEPIWGAGYPLGTKTLHSVAGVFSADNDDNTGRTALNIATAPAMSGSPIFDANDFVVGMLVRTECFSPWPTWCPVGQGVPTSAIREFLLQ